MLSYKGFDLVAGTQTIISACKKQGVERLIYCSSVSVVIGNENIYNGTEDNTHYSSDSFLFEEYGQTKMQAERMVLQANCKSRNLNISNKPKFQHNVATLYEAWQCYEFGSLKNTNLFRKRLSFIVSLRGVYLNTSYLLDIVRLPGKGSM